MVVDAGELKVSVEKAPAWARRLTITVPAARIERERKSATERLARRVKLPGFRKGKVPAHVMEKRFGAAIEQETLEKIVSEAYREALQREGLQPITQGSVENLDYHSGADLTFNVDLEVRPEIDLNRLGGFRLQRRVPVVDDAQIEQVLMRLRDQQAVWKPLEVGEAPVPGDGVVVDIAQVGSDGEPGTPRRYEIVLGEGQALPPIEEAIGTLKPGEQGEFTVDLRKDPNDDASPLEPHRIIVTVLDARRPERPELDDEFAKAVGDFAGLEELRARVREDLGREAEAEAERSLRSDLVQQIVDANPFDVPRSMVGDYLERMLPAREGANPAQLDRLREIAAPAAETALRRMLVIDRVADMEALRATPEEVDGRVTSIADRMGRPAGEVRAQLQKSHRLHEIEEEITETRVFEYLKSLSSIA